MLTLRPNDNINTFPVLIKSADCRQFWSRVKIKSCSIPTREFLCAYPKSVGIVTSYVVGKLQVKTDLFSNEVNVLLWFL